MAFSGAQITRLGVSGVPRQLYGSFAAKASHVSEFTSILWGVAYGVYIKDGPVWRHTQIVFDGTTHGTP